MCLFVFGAKVFKRHVSVFLCGCEAGVSEKFLDSAQVGSALQQVGRETMAQCVRSQTSTRRQAQARLFDQTLNVASIQPPAANTHEDRNLAIFLRLRQTQ